MTLLAPTLQAWFTDRLMTQKNASPRTITAYRDTLRLLLAFAQQQTGKEPCQLDFADLDAPLIGAFLNHLEQDRGNSPKTRNARLAAIHSLYRYAAVRHPEHAATIARVIEIPTKRHQRAMISYLDRDEIDALLEAPDRTTWLGRRDHAMLLTAIQTGVRVSELVNLTIANLALGTGAYLRVSGRAARNAARRSPGDRHRPRVVAARTARRAARSAVPEPPRRPADPQSIRGAARQAHRYRRARVPVAPDQAGHPAHPAAHQRDAAQSRERSTSTRSRCGSGMRAPNRPRFTYTPTTCSNSKRSTGPPRAAPLRAATSRPTNSSHSSNVCNCPLSASLSPFAAAGPMLKPSRGGARAAPHAPTTPPPAVKVGPSARACGAPLTGLP